MSAVAGSSIQSLGNNSLHINREPVVYEPLGMYFEPNTITFLGEGSFGEVFKARSFKSKEFKALKLMRSEPDEYNDNFIREIAFPRMLNHPNIIKIEEVLYVTFEEDMYICLVMPLYDMDLYKYIRDIKGIGPTSNNIRVMYNLASAIAHLSSKGLIHGDIKPQNILIRLTEDKQIDPNHVVLTDFGISDFAVCTAEKTPGIIYTLYQRPPEVLLLCDNYSTKLDVWALGCVFYDILVGKEPFSDDGDPNGNPDGEDEIDILNNIFSRRGNPYEIAPSLTQTKTFAQMIRNDPHFFNFKGYKPTDMYPENKLVNNLLNSMLALNIRSRSNINQVLNHQIFEDINQGAEGTEGISCEDTTVREFKPLNYNNNINNTRFVGEKLRFRNEVLNIILTYSIGNLSTVHYSLELGDKILANIDLSIPEEYRKMSSLIIGGSLLTSASLTNNWIDPYIISEETEGAEGVEEMIDGYVSLIKDNPTGLIFTTKYDYIKPMLRKSASRDKYKECVKHTGLLLALNQVFTAGTGGSEGVNPEGLRDIAILGSLAADDTKTYRLINGINKRGYMSILNKIEAMFIRLPDEYIPIMGSLIELFRSVTTMKPSEYFASIRSNAEKYLSRRR